MQKGERGEEKVEKKMSRKGGSQKKEKEKGSNDRK